MVNKQHAVVLFLLFTMFFSTHQIIARPPPYTYSASYPVFSRNNSQLIYIHDSTIFSMDTNTGKILKKTPWPHKPSAVQIFAVTPDGFKYLAINRAGIAVIHNGTGKILRTLPIPKDSLYWKSNIPYSHSLTVQNHTGVLLAIPNDNPNRRTNSLKIHLLHTGSGKVLHTIDVMKNLEKYEKESDKNRYTPGITAIGFANDNRTIAYIVTSGKGSSLHVYDIFRKSEKFKINLIGKYFDHGEIKFSKNGGQILLTTNSKQGYALVDTNTRNIQTSKVGYSSFIGFNENDQIIIIQPDSNKIILRNIHSGQTKAGFLKTRNNDGYYYNTIQSTDRKLIALTFTSRNPANLHNFIIIDTNRGKILRTIQTKLAAEAH